LLHRAFDLLEAQLAGRMQQRELLDLLVRGQQVAFDAIGEELQRALAFVAGHHALALQAQALGDPLRQRVALDRLHLDGAPLFSSAANHAPTLGLVQPRQQDQRERAVVAGGLSAICCSAALPSLPGLPEGMRISTICLSANRLSEPPAASTALQSKCAPATVWTVRSV
jgi:hypothetical protein